MKTLVNKHNPKIRITAPKIIETSLYYVLDFANDDNACETDLFKDDWTLVEEEENISWADRLKERLSKMSQEEIDKAFEEMGGDNDESPTLEEYLIAAYHSPIETEPVNLENEAVAFCFDNGINVTPYQATRIAHYFYELGRKGGNK